jgi:predicted ATPase
VKIERLVSRNFRGFDNFALDVGGRSLFLIGENAGGKSSLLMAIVRGLGRDLSFTRADFRDTQQPIEIEVSLSDFTVEQRGLYGDYIRFGPPATLVVGVRAIWNDASEESRRSTTTLGIQAHIRAARNATASRCNGSRPGATRRGCCSSARREA